MQCIIIKHFYKRTVTIDPSPQRTQCGILKIMTIMDDPLVEHDIVTKFCMYSDCHVSHLTVAKSLWHKQLLFLVSSELHCSVCPSSPAQTQVDRLCCWLGNGMLHYNISYYDVLNGLLAVILVWLPLVQIATFGEILQTRIDHLVATYETISAHIISKETVSKYTHTKQLNIILMIINYAFETSNDWKMDSIKHLRS